MTASTDADPAAERPPAALARRPLLDRDRAWLLAVAAITLLAVILRFAALRRVPVALYYDAAVRSMGHSWHNFFFGAFEPGGSASIDKPPIDLWLQVASVKLLGYKPIALKVPAALASTLAVPLLYDLVRRFSGRAAGLAAAATLAVLPVSVLTARSDTMDSLMMALLVLAAWLVVLGGERQQLRYMLGSAAILGLAFNVKLFEALVAAPALALAALVLWDNGSLRRSATRLALAGAVFVVVSLSWITVVSLTPRHERPYPIGSTNGSVWNAVFVFNGTDRLLKAPRPDRFGAPTGNVLLAQTGASVRAAPAAPRRRPRSSKSPAGPLRLFKHSVLDYGGLIGVLLLAAIAFGALALLVTRPVLVERTAAGRRRITRAGAGVGAGALWLLCGYVLFSFTARLHQRYLEAFTPAVAIAIGAGVIALAGRCRERRALLALAAALAVTLLEVVIVTGTGSIQQGGRILAVVLGLGVLAAGGLAYMDSRGARGWPSWWSPGRVAAATMLAVLAFPLARDVRLVRDHSGDEAISPALRPSVVTRLSRFLQAHQQGARYEFASAAPTVAAPLIVRDQKPILLLTSNEARPLVMLPQLQAAIASGQVRYVLSRGSCPHPRNRKLPACSDAIEWVRAHGTDVTPQLHISERSGLLYDVSAPRA